MNSIEEAQLVLIKFQPSQVLFMHKNTRTRYRYFDSRNLPLNPSIQHPHLLRAIPFKQGILYQKQQSNLQLQIANRGRAHETNIFTEEEVVNTFQPLFKCLQYLHSKSIIHGSIYASNIVLINDSIKLRDWLSPKLSNSKQYQKIDAITDIQALGLCLINCLTLGVKTTVKSQSQSQLQIISQRYSKKITLVAFIIIKQIQKYYNQISCILQYGNKSIDSKLICLYEQLRATYFKNKKKVPNKCDLAMQFSPAKKFAISSANRRVIHYENIQNKGEGERKIQKNIRILQRGNLAQQYINKKLNQQQKRLKEQSLKRVYICSPIMNLSNYGIQNSGKRITWEHTSPSQKTKNISRKK